MGELREVPIEVEYDEVSGFPLFMRSIDAEPPHEASVTPYTNGIVRVLCTCNSSWSHNPPVPSKEVEATFKAHLSYFNRPATKPD